MEALDGLGMGGTEAGVIEALGGLCMCIGPGGGCAIVAEGGRCCMCIMPGGGFPIVAEGWRCCMCIGMGGGGCAKPPGKGGGPCICC